MCSLLFSVQSKITLSNSSYNSIHYAHTKTPTHTKIHLPWLMWTVTVLFWAVNPDFSRSGDTSLIFSQDVDAPTGGADLLWSASLPNPGRQRCFSQFRWPHVSRTIICNETASNLSACVSRDAWQIRPSEGPIFILIYGSTSFPLPVTLCTELLSLCFTCSTSAGAW